MNFPIKKSFFQLLCLLFMSLMSYTQSQVVSCESINLRPQVEVLNDECNNTKTLDLLKRYYTPDEEGIGGLGCWVHPHGNGKDFVVTPYSWGRNPTPGKEGLITKVLHTMTQTRSVLAPLGQLNSGLYFLLNDVHVNARTHWIFNNQCWVEAGPHGGFGSWRDPSSQFFPGQVAHEIGHCFIMENIPNYSPNTYDCDLDNWWDESGAEFFSALVYPDLDHEHISAQRFDLDETKFTQPYAAYTLLQHYANVNGNDSVIPLLKSIFQQRSENDLKSYFRQSGFDSLYHDFAVLHYQDEVLDAGSGYIPREAFVEIGLTETLERDYSSDFVEAQDLEIPNIEPMQLFIAELTIPKRHNLSSIGYQPNNSEPIHGSILFDNGDTVSIPLSEEIEGDCNTPKTIKVLLTHINDQAITNFNLRYLLSARVFSCPPLELDFCHCLEVSYGQIEPSYAGEFEECAAVHAPQLDLGFLAYMEKLASCPGLEHLDPSTLPSYSQ